MLKSTTKSGYFASRLVGIFFIVCVLGACTFGYLYQDEFKAKDVVFSAELSKIVSSIDLTSRATTILRATHPELQQREEFNQSCNSHSQELYVLGCYKEDLDRLYVYNVKSSDLPGVREVTTAHEMLHAAFHRLHFWEKPNLEKQLQAVYNQLPRDSDLRISMGTYPKDEFHNELHSRIGTEIANLPSELEAYYTRYFNNRQQIVKFNEQYHNVFSKLKHENEQLKQSIESKKQIVESRTTNYRNSQQSLNEDIAKFNHNAASGHFTNQLDFENQRRNLIQRSNQLKKDYEQLSNDIESLNHDITKYNQNIYHNNQLIDQINSNSLPKTVTDLSRST